MKTQHQHPPIYIISALRTIMGSPFRSLKNYSAPQLAAAVIKETLDRVPIKKSDVDGVLLGNVVSSGLNQNMARQAAVWSGLPDKVTAFTVGQVCASSLQALAIGVQSIHARSGQCYIVGGAESVSQAPYLLSRQHAGHVTEDDLLESAVIDGLSCGVTQQRMGDLIEGLTEKYFITRQMQDAFALESHRKAAAASLRGGFADEIVALQDARGGTITQDDRPRQDLTLERLASLAPVFRKHGTVTAGNASSPADNAAILAIASKAYVERTKIQPLAEVMAFASYHMPCEKSFENDAFVVRACLKQAGLKKTDIDLFEIAEPFAAQSIFAQTRLKIPFKKYNINGGDVALGHPLGSAGCRLVVSLAHALKQHQKTYGLACISFGGGGGMGVVIKRAA